jgi:hypothetical protein
VIIAIRSSPGKAGLSKRIEAAVMTNAPSRKSMAAMPGLSIAG